MPYGPFYKAFARYGYQGKDQRKVDVEVHDVRPSNYVFEGLNSKYRHAAWI